MLRLLPVLGLLFSSSLPRRTGAVLDVTLLSVTSDHRRANFTLSCITGEREMRSSDLSIERDNTIVRINSAPPHTTLHKNELRVKFPAKALVGVFFCIAKGPSEHTKILYPYNNPSADLTPLRVTVTVSINQDAHLDAKVIKPSNADIMWKYNGTFFQTTYKNEISGLIARLTLHNVQLSQAGVYSGGFTGATPLANAFFRLIVRGCPEKKWGPSCQKDCLECLNGGVCHDISGECICAPGFMGTHCEKACREGNFGRNCQETCKSDQGCKGLTFCLPDPYGCSCGSGWTGDHCQKECPAGTYGANCVLECECESGGSCNRFSGCVCANGYHGQNCEKSDRHPQIVNLTSQVEFNLDSPAVLTCAASGNPQPVLGSIVLRRPDGSVITASNALLDAERSTCTFTVPTMTLNDHGLWECRVSTSGGQDNRKFRVLVKVPPTPLEPPRLLERRSRALILAPIHRFSGDGPISSIRLLYHPKGMKSDWSSIIVEEKDNISLPNLKPVTAYQVRYQLSRPGPGGEGPLGPIAVLETDCIEPSVKPEIKSYSKEDRHTIYINWKLDKYSVGNGFLVRVYHPPNQLFREVNVTSMDILSEKIYGLSSNIEYIFRVLIYHCTSLGPPSDPYHVTLNSKESHPMVPSMESRNPRVPNSGQQLLLAIIGSVSVTCFTIIVALLALFCIKKNLFRRRKMFTYQSGSGEETILQFSSGTLTLTRRPRPQTEPFTYPILAWGDIKFEDVIGEGNFGQVIKAMIKKDGVRMNAAVKMLKEFASENDHRDFAGELEVLCKLGHHPNIINLLGACENRGYLYIAIEFAPFGNLLDFLRKSRVLETDPAFAKEHGTASTLTSQQLLQFASDVAKGMQYLSEKQFIHRDLAARNILVGENLVGKIADFGLSRGEEVYVKKTMGRLPVRWMAIESLNYSVYTTKSDVWSFGVLLWEIVSLGGTPYCGMTCAELYEKLPQAYRMEKPRNCDDEVYDLMRQCWRDRPYERPTFNQISLQLIRMLEARKAYVNMALFENFTYAGIDATAEEA
ncbi:tyrosine-protein kinase receptor Tie-1 isoform X2 [Rana temporaria]|uniref:tyrosine-protein kinase receptor Tie-1 isoform X2 n=1 Tax=Rana temporaria TaxID=8407 RepID=UPI001AAD5154|nr:tyrosine-protein kinase receptor Tie-1 isoform X2 [Rana temporaria]